ncbi:MAG: class I SAM-dependent methyltransferase [Betaproteobacteria bacterium]|nr:class I SAM-dependent methyltransferase [Betaproteobacteria bacterium]
MSSRTCALRMSVVALMVLLFAGRYAGGARAADVPYVPTPWNVVDAMLGIARVGAGDFLIDLGSGDGRILITAAKRYGTRGFGVDIDGALVSDAKREANRQGVSDKVEFHERNLFITDIGKATVLTMYLLPRVNLQLRPRLFAELKPGTRVVSHDFDMEAWQPDDKIRIAVPDKPYGAPSSDVFLWIVPADASGRWQWRLEAGGVPRDYDLTLEQTFQQLQGKSVVAGANARIGNGRMRGENISFVLVADFGGRPVRHEFSGRLSGDTITGGVALQGHASAKMEWQARRSARGKINLGAGLPASEQRMLIAEER